MASDTTVVELRSEAARRLIPETATVERISGGHLFTEGPVWHARHGALLWCDIAGDTIWQWVPTSGPSPFRRPSGKSNGLTLDREGRLVAAGWTSRSVWRLEDDGSVTALVTHHDGIRIGTPNDIVVRSDGSVYWTDGTSGARHPGFETTEDLQIYRRSSVVMRWDPRSRETRVATDRAGSCNGLAFSRDETQLYVNDSSARQIDVFPVRPDGSLGEGRVFATNTGSATKVDLDGNVWCTGPFAVHLLDASGAIAGRIPVPEKPSNLAWGEDWSTLFITAQTSVFRVRLRVRGVPVGPHGP